jgi:hemoglobin
MMRPSPPARRFAVVCVTAALLSALLSAPTLAADPVGAAGATPMPNQAVFEAFHGKAGIDRIVDTLITLSVVDPRISDIFKNQDLPHLRQMLDEQICYILDGPCLYSGKDMHTAHKDMGLQMSDFNALVENLQAAMDKEGVPFRAQNKLLAKLAPMERTVVVR